MAVAALAVALAGCGGASGAGTSTAGGGRGGSGGMMGGGMMGAGGTVPGGPTTGSSTGPTATTATTATGTAAAGQGAALFVSSGCGSCHTLAAAGTTGTAGPNLDRARPSYDTVVRQVTNGGGGMPGFGGSLSAAQIRAIARYVADSTG